MRFLVAVGADLIVAVAVGGFRKAAPTFAVGIAVALTLDPASSEAHAIPPVTASAINRIIRTAEPVSLTNR